MRLRRRWGGEASRQFSFEVPEEARSGETLRVEANDERSFLDRDRGERSEGRGLMSLFGSRRDEGPAAKSLGELIEGMNRSGRPNVVMLRVSRTQDGVRDGWGRHDDVPASVTTVLRNGPSGIETIADAVIAELWQETDGVVGGSATARLVVQ